MKRAVIVSLVVACLCPAGTAAENPLTLEALRRIHAPQVVGVPPINASHDLMVMPDGEIRHYGFRGGFGKEAKAVEPVYISSRDCGLSWREVTILRAQARYLRQVRIPFSQDYMEMALNNNVNIAKKLVELFEIHCKFIKN